MITRGCRCAGCCASASTQQSTPRRCTAQTLLLVARQDEIIPPVHAERLARAFPQHPSVQWLDTDHNTTEMDGHFVLALQRHFRAHAWQHRPNPGPETPRSE
ncbi:MAG: alpha/beta hydrolase [Rhodanobacteraceae bacterium]|nr:alpha/beta hydrolase [Rhodanobacteraceae bacterium]